MRTDGQTTGSAKGPVLVTGMPRSGTSLLAGILRNHPSLAIPKVESTWWTRIYPRYRGVRDPVQWDGFLNELFRMRATHQMGLALEPLMTQAGRCAPGDFAAVFSLLLEEYARRQGRPRWGEKSPSSYRRAKDMLEWFPTAKFVHIVRDPRDMLASLRKVRFTDGLNYWFTTSATVAGMEWRESVRISEELEQQLPTRYRTLRYEDLATQPEETIRSLCEFLDEDYLPEILDVTDRLSFGDSNSHFERIQGISQKPIGRGRKLLEPADRWLLEKITGTSLGRWGYDREPAKWSMSAGVKTPVAVIQATMFGVLRLARRLAPGSTERQAVLLPNGEESLSN